MVPLNGPLAPRCGVGVDPLVIARGVGEQIHLLLRDLHPVGGSDLLADKIDQVRRCLQDTVVMIWPSRDASSLFEHVAARRGLDRRHAGPAEATSGASFCSPAALGEPRDEVRPPGIPVLLSRFRPGGRIRLIDGSDQVGRLGISGRVNECGDVAARRRGRIGDPCCPAAGHCGSRPATAKCGRRSRDHIRVDGQLAAGPRACRAC